MLTRCEKVCQWIGGAGALVSCTGMIVSLAAGLVGTAGSARPPGWHGRDGLRERRGPGAGRNLTAAGLPQPHRHPAPPAVDRPDAVRRGAGGVAGRGTGGARERSPRGEHVCADDCADGGRAHGSGISFGVSRLPGRVEGQQNPPHRLVSRFADHPVVFHLRDCGQSGIGHQEGSRPTDPGKLLENALRRAQSLRTPPCSWDRAGHRSKSCPTSKMARSWRSTAELAADPEAVRDHGGMQ